MGGPVFEATFLEVGLKGAKRTPDHVWESRFGDKPKICMVSAENCFQGHHVTFVTRDTDSPISAMALPKSEAKGIDSNYTSVSYI